MKKETNLCMSCMTPREDVPRADECPHCGWIDKGVHLASYLTPRTFLAGRYIVGKLISYNGESAKYAGFDTLAENKVTIKEYMPDALCSRSRDVLIVSVNSGEMPLYKTYLSEFIELNRSLQSFGSLNGIQRVTDVFTENNTAYAVYEHVGGVNVKTYLQTAEGGILSFTQVKALFPPIFTALSRVNAAGIIHRGISPKTVYINTDSDKHEAFITDFSITAARIYGSKINEEVFAGYAAPEQYNTLERHGDWTDVYSLSALLYNALTGIDPLDAPDRIVGEEAGDILAEPMMLNGTVPENLSKKIMSGMELSVETRIKTAAELGKSLFGKVRAAADTLTAMPTSGLKNTGEGFKPVFDLEFDEESDRKTEPEIDSQIVEAVERSLRKEAYVKKQKIKMIIMISLIAAVVIFFLVLIILANNGFFEGDPSDEGTQSTSAVTTEQTEETVITTPAQTPPNVAEGQVTKFTGLFFREEWAKDYPYLTFIFKPEYHETEEKGKVFEQSIEPLQIVKEGTEIIIKYSLGKEKVKFPEFEGNTVGKLVENLKKLGVDESNIRIDDNTPYSAAVNDDFIESCNFAKDDEIRITSHPDDNTMKADIIVIKRVVPETTEAVTTAAPTAAPTSAPTSATAAPTTAQTTTAAPTTAATTATVTTTTTTAATTTAPVTEEATTPAVTEPEQEG